MTNRAIHIYPLVSFCHRSIMNMRPTSLSYGTRVFASLKPNCGLKGATILHNWLPSCNSILWDAGSGRPLLFCPNKGKLKTKNTITK